MNTARQHLHDVHNFLFPIQGNCNDRLTLHFRCMLRYPSTQAQFLGQMQHFLRHWLPVGNQAAYIPRDHRLNPNHHHKLSPIDFHERSQPFLLTVNCHSEGVWSWQLKTTKKMFQRYCLGTLADKDLSFTTANCDLSIGVHACAI